MQTEGNGSFEERYWGRGLWEAAVSGAVSFLLSSLQKPAFQARLMRSGDI